METPHYKIARHRENNNLGDSRSDKESILIRSSLDEQPIVDEMEEVLKEEGPEIPAVAAMKKTTLADAIKNLRWKLFGIFNFKNKSAKQDYRTRRRRKNYSRSKAKSSYANKNKPRKSRNRSATAKSTSAYKKSPRPQSASPSTQSAPPSKRSTPAQSSRKRPSRFSPLKSSMHSNRRRRQYQKNRTADEESQSHTPPPSQHGDTIDSPTPQQAPPTKAFPGGRGDNPPPSTPSEPKPVPDNAFKPPQFNNQKPKLVQVETKPKIDNNPK